MTLSPAKKGATRNFGVVVSGVQMWVSILFSISEPRNTVGIGICATRKIISLIAPGYARHPQSSFS